MRARITRTFGKYSTRIERELTQLQWPVWGSERPLTLAWIVVALCGVVTWVRWEELKELAKYNSSPIDWCGTYRQARVDAPRAALGEQHTDYATGLNNLAAVLMSRREYPEADSLLRRAVALHNAAGDSLEAVAAGSATVTITAMVGGASSDARERPRMVAHRADRTIVMPASRAPASSRCRPRGR